MASLTAIAIKRGESIARIVSALGVTLPTKRNLASHANEFHEAETLGAIADAVDLPPLENIPGVAFDLTAATTPQHAEAQ